MTQLDMGQIKTPAFILRAVEFVFSIITFSCIAEYAGDAYWSSTDSKISYTIFTGVTSFLLCGFFIACYFLGMRKTKMFNLVELTLTAIWWVFWLACAAALADLASDVGTWSGTSIDDKVKASCAFAWLTWFLWTASCFFIFLDFKESSSGATDKSAVGVPAGTAAGLDGRPVGAPPV